ncbi:PadR family transcriptional regulator [Candidatus Micrarchaeota archaeon]|nr:PadR family transcriptional regulator [Candidatus Micrarchaeota archaeon]
MIIDGKIFSSKNFINKLRKEKFSIFLLWMMSRKEQHGYEIIKTINKDPCIPSFPASRIYPLLHDLSQKGLLSQKKIMQGKRSRKIYAITAKGRAVLEKAKEHLNKSPLVVAYMEDMLK